VSAQGFQKAVMDVSPWPKGKGFSGSSVWWEYVLSKTEVQRLESLIGMALLDQSVCERLVNVRDDALLEAFDLSHETREWLRMIKASTLSELAEAISVASNPPLALSAI
jgi:hypothetical protein